MNKYFTKEAIYVSNNHMKRHSISLVIRKMQDKTTMTRNKIFCTLTRIEKN